MSFEYEWVKNSMQNNILVQVTEKMIYLRASLLLRSCLIIERLSILNNECVEHTEVNDGWLCFRCRGGELQL